MATPIVFNGVNYSVPAFGDVGYAQGPGNLSSYLIALASGTFQTTGGLFSLTSQADFGPNFGLTAVNFTSGTANPAVAGAVRLAVSDSINWRNNLNTLDLPLAINASDQLTFNGTVIGLVGGSVTSVTGTVNQINSTGGTTPVLSLSSTLVFPGTATGTLTGHSTLDLPLTGGTLTGALSLPDGTVSLPSLSFANDLDCGLYRIGADNLGLAINAAKLLDMATTGLGIHVADAVTTTVTDVLALSHTSTGTADPNFGVGIVFQSEGDDGGAAGSIARVQAILTGGSGSSQYDSALVFKTRLAGNVDEAGRFASTGAFSAKGTTTNNSAAAGYIGEFVSSQVLSVVFPATTQYGDFTSISLTAGDWDVTASYIASFSGVTGTQCNIGISSTSGNSTSGLVNGANLMVFLAASAATMPVIPMMVVPVYRFSLSATTTIYGKFMATYTVGSPNVSGRLSARRIR